MATSLDFIPPEPTPWVHAAARLTMPLWMSRLGIVGVDYDPADLERLRSLAAERVLLTPNHPTNQEPALLFHLSCAVRKPFFYLATRDSFDQFWGLWGNIIRRVGAYSVVRGATDRASYKVTRELLATRGAHLVVFPEGEVYSQNDTLLPFHQGVFQIAFWALEDARKAGDEGPLYVLPLAIKYYFTRDMGPDVAASLARLERFTGVGVEPLAAPYARLRRIGQAILKSVEREYRLPTPKEAEVEQDDLTPRLEAIKEAILARVASAAGVALPKGDTLPERMRALIHVIETVNREEPEDDAGRTPFDAQLRRQQRERARPLLHDLRRLSNWVAVYDGYVRENPTQERMADTLVRLERECFGRVVLAGPRRCRVDLGEPIDLSQCWEAYQKNKRGEVARFTRQVEEAVQGLLWQSPGATAQTPGSASS